MDVMSQWLVLPGRVVYPFFLLTGLLFSSLYAQATERQITPVERTLERQQQLDLLQQQADKLKQLQDLPQPVVSEPIVTEDSNAQCFSINHIELDGASLLSTAEHATLLSPWLNTCVGIAQMNRLPSNQAQLKLQPGSKPGETVAL
ncbi:POTRA domain-containing protein [Endozoicomonas acroporae]|uniref:POTRA domain-containing protein n=1 Tax=Endozoicomonas acroporae TaxID=1701104 RepID=UPI000C7766BE|nr:POTRA domain-containing protein [Endozoicomonas acroporae]